MTNPRQGSACGRWRFAAGAFLAVLLSSPSRAAAVQLDGGQAGLEEEFLFEPEREVEAAGKTRVKHRDTPMEVVVLTREEIRRSGLRTIPELLRRVLGVEVARLSVPFGSVAVRGNLNFASDNMLVLVDGISYYDPFFGTTRWETIPVLVDDIDSIEVVRGPAGALYGANASRGVIAIKTRSPSEGGGGFHAGVGNRDVRFSEGRWAGPVGDGWHLKAAAAYEESDTFRRPAPGIPPGKGLVLGRGRVELMREVAGGATYTWFLDGIRSRKASIVVPPGITGKEDLLDGGLRYRSARRTIDLYAGYQTVRFSLVRSDRNRIFQLAGRYEEVLWKDESFDLLGGFEVRHIDSMAPATLDRHARDTQTAGFLRARLAAGEDTDLWLAGRLENDPTADRVHFAPTLSAVHHLGANHALRLSLGRGFRFPGEVHAYGDFDFLSTKGLFRVVGDPKLRPARNDSIELSYHGELSSWFRGRVAVFHTRRRSLIATKPAGSGRILEANLGRVSVRGAELEADFMLRSDLHGRIGYAYQVDRGNQEDLTTPHTVKAFLSYDAGGTSFDFGLVFQSRRRAASDVGVLAPPPSSIPASWFGTFRLSHRFGERGPEIGFNAWNVFDVDGPELPMAGTPEFRFSLDFRMDF